MEVANLTPKIIPSDFIIGVIRIHINKTTDKKEIKDPIEET